MSELASPTPASDVFGTPPPLVSAAQAEAIVASRYGIIGKASPLASERDANFRVAAGGEQFVLKIANASESAGDIAMQYAALRHLRSVLPAMRVPGVVEPLTEDDLWVSDAGATHTIRLVTWISGRPLAETSDVAGQAAEIGRFLGRLSRGFAGFGHPAAHRAAFLWNLDGAQACRSYLVDIADPERRALVGRALDRHRDRVLPRLGRLRRAVVHQDANDYNVIVDDDGSVGLIDFGDMVFTTQVNELAVGLAYLLLHATDLIATATATIAAYHAEFPLLESEAEVLFDLVAARLAMSVAISSHRSRAFPDNEYLLISQAPAYAVLSRLDGFRPDFLRSATRAAAGFPAVAAGPIVDAWLRSPACRPAPVLGGIDLTHAGRFRTSLRTGAPGVNLLGDPTAYQSWVTAQLTEEGAAFTVGAYGELRDIYSTDAFDSDGGERRTVHLGIDIGVPAGTPVQAMLNGTVVSVVDNAWHLDYGPTVILEHTAGTNGPPFWVLYGHLSRETLSNVSPGQQVHAGETVAWIGNSDVNGGWPPHLHVQLMTDLLENRSGNFEGVGEPSRMHLWGAICPDPNPLVRLTPESFTESPTQVPALLERRAAAMGSNLSISYRRKLHIVRGEGTYLIDAQGRTYLDCVNNVAHVGHANPRVVEALAHQAAQLNTNTRYLHRSVLDFSDRLAALFPDPLHVVYLVNSGSEANELALRLARTATARRDVITLDWAYHGNTASVLEISPYKFKRAGGFPQPPHIHVAELPDPYRGRYGNDGAAYAASVATCVAAARRPAAFIAESVSGCGGQVELADGYLPAAFEIARQAGAVCIIDEVQVGLGRVGDAMWGFSRHGVIPDIVTVGKPLGNGHPLAAVITTTAIAKAFANGMEYFNTFGGNPVSCEVGLAVLDVIEQDRLQDHAASTGAGLLDGLRALQSRHRAIGDVRGRGLFIGIDLVTDRATKAPATALAANVANRLRNAGILISTDGPHDNVLKIKPPMTFSPADAAHLCAALDVALSES